MSASSAVTATAWSKSCRLVPNRTCLDLGEGSVGTQLAQLDQRLILKALLPQCMQLLYLYIACCNASARHSRHNTRACQRCANDLSLSNRCRQIGRSIHSFSCTHTNTSSSAFASAGRDTGVTEVLADRSRHIESNAASIPIPLPNAV